MAQSNENKPVDKKVKKTDKNKKPNIFVRFGRKIKETFSEIGRASCRERV